MENEDRLYRKRCREQREKEVILSHINMQEGRKVNGGPHLSYTLAHPGAVVVKLFYAVVADAAVARPRGAVQHACVAVLHFHNVAVHLHVFCSGQPALETAAFGRYPK